MLAKEKFLTSDSPPLCQHASLDDDMIEFLTRYIATKPYEDNAESNDLFPAFINTIVDKIMELDCRSGDAEKVRYGHIRTLFHRIAKRVHLNGGPILDRAPLRSPWESVLVAAIYLDNRTVIAKLMTMKRFLSLENKSEVSHRALMAAVWMENLDLTRTLLERGAWPAREEASIYRSCFDTAVQASNAEEVVPMLLDACECRPNRVTMAIPLAFELGKLAVATSLCSFSNRDLTLALCENGWQHGLEELRHQGFQPALCMSHMTITRHDYYMAAAQGGHVSSARMLLEAGEKLTQVQGLSLLLHAAPTPRATEVIRYLLDCGAIRVDQRNEYDEQVANTRVAYCMMLAAQRGNIGFIEALVRHGVPVDDEDDEEFYKDDDVPPPIIAAMAFRQTETVVALKRLGARDRDPMDSIIARHFESGKYPCDPETVSNSNTTYYELFQHVKIRTSYEDRVPYLIEHYL
ncbi:hypothetical protein BDV95DRAFT_607443 [Massariosphaeria phaeospora]|uniref:Ankyrin repeat-containing domain protein n=1 Tax=Massariosphaeria phaeospora TaxID=100035 RepID=A0A7C8I900_9PLEO|nr:hypothetical protein BDV95DRAFT_607443 [Massariosphaeria phaeospora]